MEKLRIVLCDTNRQEREGHGKICRAICERNNIPAEFKLYSNGRDLLFDMGDEEFAAWVSLLIIDPDNGLDSVASAIRKKGYDGMILYLSHSDSPELYRQAFDVGAYNFVQKGTGAQILSRFGSVFESAIKAARHIDRQYLAVSYAGEFRRIEVKNILYFESAADHMVNVVYRGGSFKFLSTIQSLEERFGERGFLRVHRSYLVSGDTIHRVDPDGVTLNNGHRISVSRNRYHDLKKAMLSWQS